MLVKRDDASKKAVSNILQRINDTLADKVDLENLKKYLALIFFRENVGQQIFDRRHPVLLRLRADAQVAAHQGGREVLRRLRDPGEHDRPVEVHPRNVRVGCLHPELSRRSGKKIK